MTFSNNKTLFSLFTVLGLVFVMGWVSTAQAFKTKTSKQNMVTIEVKPVQLSPGKLAKFKVSMNTHTVELNHDLKALSILTDNQGREYRPQMWKGPPGGGHHREGVLLFPKLMNDVKTVELVIKNVADVPARSFMWQVKR